MKLIFSQFTNNMLLKIRHTIWIKTGIILLILAIGVSSYRIHYKKKEACAWGFWAHQRINRMAVFTLPPDMIGFYKRHIEYLTEHAIDPDKRRYATEGEAPRHYIDIDHYGEYPWENVPRKWEDAVATFSEDTLMAYGIGPWNTEKWFYKLTRAFANKDKSRILRLSAEIGHYIGDGCVPLHNTINYNGQLTGQKGIHGFWESRIPELYGDDYDYWVGKAKFVPDVNSEIWDYILESAVAVDSVLTFERMLTEQLPSDQKYCEEFRGQTQVKTYCEEFARAFSDRLNNMQERRMRRAITTIGSFWFTAWLNAGQPDLDALDTKPLSEKELLKQQELELNFSSGKMKGRQHQN